MLLDIIYIVEAVMTIIVSAIAIGGTVIAHKRGFFVSLHAAVKHHHELAKKQGGEAGQTPPPGGGG